MNSTKLDRVGITPAKAIKLETVDLKVKPYGKEEAAPTNGLYRYLLEPGEENSHNKRRATDNIWSRKTFRLNRIIRNKGQRVLYYLAPSGAADGNAWGPERVFIRKEMMNIPEDTQMAPEWVEKW